MCAHGCCDDPRTQATSDLRAPPVVRTGPICTLMTLVPILTLSCPPVPRAPTRHTPHARDVHALSQVAQCTPPGQDGLGALQWGPKVTLLALHITNLILFHCAPHALTLIMRFRSKRAQPPQVAQCTPGGQDKFCASPWVPLSVHVYLIRRTLPFCTLRHTRDPPIPA